MGGDCSPKPIVEDSSEMYGHRLFYRAKTNLIAAELFDFAGQPFVPYHESGKSNARDRRYIIYSCGAI